MGDNKIGNIRIKYSSQYRICQHPSSTLHCRWDWVWFCYCSKWYCFPNTSPLQALIWLPTTVLMELKSAYSSHSELWFSFDLVNLCCCLSSTNHAHSATWLLSLHLICGKMLLFLWSLPFLLITWKLALSFPSRTKSALSFYCCRVWGSWHSDLGNRKEQ